MIGRDLKMFLCVLVVITLVSRSSTLGERISVQKCEEYLKLYEARDLTSFISDNNKAQIGEFPHMTAIGIQDERTQKINFHCAGSLISERFVLSAAHCKTQTTLRFFVQIGSTNIANRSVSGITDYEVEEFITSPNYENNLDFDGYRHIVNDIGLLKLMQEVSFDSKLRLPACLNQNEFIYQAHSYIDEIGWGHPGVDDLVKTKISILTGCLPRSENYICGYEASYWKPIEWTNESGICDMDSRSILQLPIKGKAFSIVGVSSYRIECEFESAAIYANVTYFLDWIENHVWPSEAEFMNTNASNVTELFNRKAEENSSGRMVYGNLLFFVLILISFCNFL